VAPRDKKTRLLLKAVGQAVREARDELGVSQEELGFESELDRTYISGIERGVRNPTVETLSRLCRSLGVRVSELIARAEELGA
jgi:transcriptional regulator with XRE-family HTH domain